MDREQFQRLLSRTTLAMPQRALLASWRVHRVGTLAMKHLAKYSPDSNCYVFLWMEVVIASVIQTLILWFFQVNEIGNPHCGEQRDGN